MSKKKKLIITFIFTLILSISTYLVYYIFPDDYRINRFTGAFGAIRLNVPGVLYVQLDDDPIIILVKKDNIDEFLIKYFNDSEKDDLSYKSGGIRNGVKYNSSAGLYTSHYFILTITPA